MSKERGHRNRVSPYQHAASRVSLGRSCLLPCPEGGSRAPARRIDDGFCGILSGALGSFHCPSQPTRAEACNPTMGASSH